MQSSFPLVSRATISQISPSLIREIANEGMDRPDMLAFWFGESDKPTPKFITDAAITSLQQGETRYIQNLGRPYLRQALSDYLSQLHGHTISSDQLAITSAGINGLMLVAQTVLSPGDKVVAITPVWPNVVEIPQILGASVERVALTVKDDAWALDMDLLLAALTPDVRMLIINSPGNPTGWTITDDEVQTILAHCRKHGIWILSDDAYQRLIYASDRHYAPSFLDYATPDDRLISVNTFSKAWLMTGFRVGWVVAPPSIIDALEKLIEFNTSCLFEPCQRAAQAALLGGESGIISLRAELVHSYQFLVRGLRELPGVSVPESGGGMYAFFRIEGFDDTTTLAKRLVRESSLGLAPGAAFGPEGNGWLRWCHAVSSTDKLQQGLARLSEFLARNR
jgi:aspartate aminotransferase